MDSLKAPSLSSLLSGTDRGSSDSLLGSLNFDLDDIDCDDDLSIPPVAELPSLDVVMSEIDVDSDIDSIHSNSLISDSIKSFTPIPPHTSHDDKSHSGSILRHVIFQGITAQIASAQDRTEAGYASAICVSRMTAVGTSHGYILAFDSTQTLKWCNQEGQKKQQGAVAALSFNIDDTRLLAGFSRGAILMINTMTGDVLRSLIEAISPNSGVLSLKWTSRPTLSLALDSGGSLWSLSFTRRMGIRGCDSRCLFSGARGEVCTFEPLILADEQHPFQHSYTLLALATLSKFFILMIRPRLKVIKYHTLNGPPESLPLLSWQMVLIQSADASRTVDPVLATGRGTSLYFHQISYKNGRINVTFLRHITLSYNLLSLHWLGPKNIACVERDSEMLHLIDVRTSRELESTDLSSFGITYSSAQFKGIATGSNVSPALALAGTYACYSTIVSNDLNSTLYILGKRSLHGINARSWSDRLTYLTTRRQWTEAFELAIDGYRSTSDKPRRHSITKERILLLFSDYLNGTSRSPDLCLETVIRCLIEIERQDLLWQELWDRLYSQEIYLNIITQQILDDNLTLISPFVSQALLDYWSKLSVEKLEIIILKLEWHCLDLHQTLNLVKNLHLYKALMHLNTKALNDYAISLVELIPLIDEHTEFGDRSLGNNILVYISSCLAGRGYPTGEIAHEMIFTVKHEIMRTLTATHSLNAPDNEPAYPYLRSLLKFDTRETLNVLSLAFMEQEFSTELGLSQRQRIINILLEIISGEGEENERQFGILCNFISQQITSQNLPDSSLYLAQIVNYIITEDNVNSITSRQHIEKEQTFMNLMEANALSGRFGFQELLEIAMKTKCYVVARFILEKLKRYEKMIECYVLSNDSHELFRYIMEYKNSDERKIFQQILENFHSLLEMDCERISKLIIEFYPICIPQFLESVESVPKLNYSFLNELITNCSVQLDDCEYDKFLKLLCQFNSAENVLEFLQNPSHNYDLDKALELCKEKVSCVIYLHEKRGEYRKAFTLSMDLLKEAPESLAEAQALRLCSLCTRISNSVSDSERESFWFELIETVLSRKYLSSIVKQVLHLSSSFVDLTKLVQLIMRSDGEVNNFGDIKHILIDMLTNFEYESLLLKTTQNIFGKDLHKKLLQEKQQAEAGIYGKSLKCFLCKKKLTNGIFSEEDHIIVLSICGHSVHNSCFQKNDKYVDENEEEGTRDYENLNSIKCQECGVVVHESDSIYINKTNYFNLLPNCTSKEEAFDLKLKSPTRYGFL